MDDQTAERFARIEDDMAGLKEQATATAGMVKRLDEDFYNHGQDGFKTKLTKFIAKWEEREEGRDRSSKRFRFIVTSILAVLGLMATLYVGLKANDQIQRNELVLPHFFHSQSQGRG